MTESREKNAEAIALHTVNEHLDQHDLARLIARVVHVQVDPNADDLLQPLTDEQVATVAAHVAQPQEFNLSPDFDQIRKTYTAQARAMADTILADLLPEELIPPEHLKAVQASVLRTFQGLLHSLNIVAQCATNNDDVVALRRLASYVASTIEAKAIDIERLLNAAATQDETGSPAYRIGVMTEAVDLLKAAGLHASYEYPGFLRMAIGGTHGDAQFGDSSDDGYGANWEDGTGIEFTAPYDATAEDLAEAIVAWVATEGI